LPPIWPSEPEPQPLIWPSEPEPSQPQPPEPLQSQNPGVVPLVVHCPMPSTRTQCGGNWCDEGLNWDDLPSLPPERDDTESLDKCRRFREHMRQSGCAVTVVCRKQRVPAGSGCDCGCGGDDNCSCNKKEKHCHCDDESSHGCKATCHCTR